MILIALFITGCGADESKKETPKKEVPTKKVDPSKEYYGESESTIYNEALAKYNVAVAEYTKAVPACKDNACIADQMDKVRETIKGLLEASNEIDGEFNSNCEKAQEDWNAYLVQYINIWGNHANLVRSGKADSPDSKDTVDRSVALASDLPNRQQPLIQACYTQEDIDAATETDPAKALKD